MVSWLIVLLIGLVSVNAFSDKVGIRNKPDANTLEVYIKPFDGGADIILGTVTSGQKIKLSKHGASSIYTYKGANKFALGTEEVNSATVAQQIKDFAAGFHIKVGTSAEKTLTVRTGTMQDKKGGSHRTWKLREAAKMEYYDEQQSGFGDIPSYYAYNTNGINGYDTIGLGLGILGVTAVVIFGLLLCLIVSVIGCFIGYFVGKHYNTKYKKIPNEYESQV